MSSLCAGGECWLRGRRGGTAPGWLARRIGSRVFRDLRTHRGFPLKGSIRGPLKGSIGFRDLRTHILRLLGPKTILYKAFGLF